MNKIALILPYFGKLPNYFPLWILSAKKNDFIDFYILTDQVAHTSQDNNIYYIKTAFPKLKEKIQSYFDFEIVLNRPYKLCDYKPAFGIILSDLIKGYEYWGHCDSDVIWGNLKHFLNEELMTHYDKFYCHGHLTIYRNTQFVNNLYKKSTDLKMLGYKDVFQIDYPCHFDESEGMTKVCNELNIPTYEAQDFADINYRSFSFKRANASDNTSYVYKWLNGRLLEYSLVKNNEKKVKEIAYLHLQKRDMTLEFDLEICPLDCFMIAPNSFLKCNEESEPSEVFLKNNTKNKIIYSDYYKCRFKIIKYKFLNGYFPYKFKRLLKRQGY